jgi:hypothetical protein
MISVLGSEKLDIKYKKKLKTKNFANINYYTANCYCKVKIGKRNVLNLRLTPPPFTLSCCPYINKNHKESNLVLIYRLY